MRAIVRDALAPYPIEGEGGLASRAGSVVTMDFLQWLMLIGACFQVRAGTITTPLVGDVVLTDAAAEMAVSVGVGRTILPLEMGLGVRLATGTLHEYAVKSVAGAHSGGTAFVPLPLRTFGRGNAAALAAQASAAVGAAGGVTVPAELATTTRRHWEYSNPVAAGAGNDVDPLLWTPKLAVPLAGAWCLYLQVAATGTGPSYYAHLDYAEVDTDKLV